MDASVGVVSETANLISKINYVWLNKAYGYGLFSFQSCIPLFHSSIETSVTIKNNHFGGFAVIWSEFFSCSKWIEWWISLCFVKQILSFAVQPSEWRMKNEQENMNEIYRKNLWLVNNNSNNNGHWLSFNVFISITSLIWGNFSAPPLVDHRTTHAKLFFHHSLATF